MKPVNSNKIISGKQSPEAAAKMKPLKTFNRTPSVQRWVLKPGLVERLHAEPESNTVHPVRHTTAYFMQTKMDYKYVSGVEP